MTVQDNPIKRIVNINNTIIQDQIINNQDVDNFIEPDDIELPPNIEPIDIDDSETELELDEFDHMILDALLNDE